MAPTLDYPVFDADNHLYETQDCFTRHLPSELSHLIRYVQVNGRTKIVVRNMLSDFIPNPTFEVVAKPGATAAYFSGNNPEGRSLRELMGEPMRSIPAFRTPQDRLDKLDELGIHSTIVFPTLASLIEVNFLDLPEVTSAIVSAYNRWLLDEWQYDYQNRIFATPILNPAVVEDAIRELDFVLDHGAKVVLVRPGPVAGSPRTRSPFLPEFDPFWARVEESGILVALHASDSGYQQYVNDWEGRDVEFSGFKPSAFALASMGDRPISDTVFSAICHGMLWRFPEVRLFSVENGGGWVAPVLKALDLVFKKIPQDFPEHPRDTFARCFWINPFWEESIDDLIDLVGADRVCWGSDWPHAEGLADPLGWVAEIAHRRDDEIRRIMGQNVYELLGLPMPARG